MWLLKLIIKFYNTVQKWRWFNENRSESLTNVNFWFNDHVYVLASDVNLNNDDLFSHFQYIFMTEQIKTIFFQLIIKRFFM
jgi:hypothetical protein